MPELRILLPGPPLQTAEGVAFFGRLDGERVLDGFVLEFGTLVLFAATAMGKRTES